MECHDSSVFLIRKLPLSITEALLKSMEWSWDHAWFAILEPLAAVLHFLSVLIFHSKKFLYIITSFLVFINTCTTIVIVEIKMILMHIFMFN